MATLLHVTGEGHDPLPAFAGHLVRNVEWHRYTPDAVDPAVDTVVASLETPADAVRLVVDLRDSDRLQPVILLTHRAPGWSSVSRAFDGVSVVTDVAELRRALGTHDDVHVLQPQTDEQARRLVPRGGPRGMLLERLADHAGKGAHQPAGRDDRELWAALAVAPGARAPDVEPSRRARVPQPAAPTGADLPAAAADDRGRRPRRAVHDPDALVHALVDVTDRLYGVRETGTAVAAHVRDAVGVDAVAVLLPDGVLWTVVGAVGLRHLEERLTLDHSHWLVREVTQGRHGVIVEDTDIVRSRLSGAPLAAWPHLLAFPLRPVDGLVVMARSDNGPAFGSRDLARASGALAESGALFASAVRVRELARRLRRYAELDDDPG